MKKILFILSVFCCLFSEAQELKFAKIFNNHAILQRDTELPVWGWAKPRTRVKVTFQGKTYKAKTNKKGKWEVKLPATPYGGPYELSVKSKKEEVVLEDIYIGDIWICSGQSNMAFLLSGATGGLEEMKKPTDYLLREFRIPRSNTDYPDKELESGEWKIATPNNAASFSAVGYYFAKYVRREFPNLAIGLVNNSWGGSKIEPFMSAKSFGKTQKKILSEIDEIIKKNRSKQLKMLSYLGGIPEKDEGVNGDVFLWADPNLDDSSWETMNLPELWENAGLKNVDGFVWFRKEFQLKGTGEGGFIKLLIGRIDDDAEIFINGTRIDNLFDRTYGYSNLREYDLKKSIFKKGRNVITVRVKDTGGAGGIGGGKDELRVETSLEKINLAGAWKYKIGKIDLAFLYGPRQKPTTIYNKMVHPINDFKAKGVLWYQGESNTGSVEEAKNYEKSFKTMIQQWRADRNDMDLPFYFVQLASFRPEAKQPKGDNWVHLRQSQFKTLELPNTGMASAIDIGEAYDIHPRNKKEVARRLSLIALNRDYGKPGINYKNPTYKSHEIKDGKFKITFQDFGKELISKNKYGHVNGFAIAGIDGVYKWANATLKNGVVTVWNSEIENPVSLQYACEVNVLDASLFSDGGLPVVPFVIK